MFNGFVMTLITSVAILSVTSDSPAHAQAPSGAPAGVEAQPFKPEELEQLVAPIALYPDSLIAQILMASTYPLEVVQAERWASQNKSLKEDALAAALEKQPWDPSVKSLVAFPQVLTMMNEKLDWTTNLGDAFLAQQKQVMDAIQKLRKKAKDNGNLESNEQQKIIVEPAPPPPAGDTTTTTTTTVTETYIIESANPQVVYVPTYNPTVVYGSWPYPAYPPYSYYPPGYVAGTAALSFGLGVAAGAIWANNGWGSCNWGHGDVDIDVRGGNSFNRSNINNSRNVSNVGNRSNSFQGGSGKWQHDASHRKGASYRDQNTANKFGGTSTRDAAQARDSFRGRSDAGRQDLARGGADQFKGRQGASAGSLDQRGPGSSAGNRDQRGQGPGGGARDQVNRGGAASRPQSADRSRQSPAQNRPAQGNRSSPSQGNRGGAFDSGSGSSARRDSQRGQASRSSSPSRSGSSRPSGGGASRGGGGGSRGGAGMSRGGGGGGRGGRR